MDLIGFRRPAFPLFDRYFITHYLILKTLSRTRLNLNMISKESGSETPPIITLGMIRVDNYVIDSSKEKHSLQVESVSIGQVSRIGIFTGGDDYKIGDKVVFDYSKTTGSNAYEVSHSSKEKR